MCAKRMQKTLPDVFIIESLDRESNGDVQGRALAQALKAFGRYPRYVDVANKFELINALKDFEISEYRYLHISAHGDVVNEGLRLRNDETVSYEEIADELSKLKLKSTRLFLSACCAGAKSDFAEALFSRTSVHSVLAPAEDIDLIESLLFWTAFYGEMYMHDKDSMENAAIVQLVQSLVNCCTRKFSYYSYNTGKKTVRHWSIKYKKVQVSTPLEWGL